MFSVVPNIVLAPNMTQNAERKHRTQDANTAPIRPRSRTSFQLEDEVSDTTSYKLETCPGTELFRRHFKDHSRCNLTCWCRGITLDACSLIRKIERKNVADNHFVISCGSRILEARRMRNTASLWACGRFRQPAFFVIYFKDRSCLTWLLIYFSWLIDLLYRFFVSQKIQF